MLNISKIILLYLIMTVAGGAVSAANAVLHTVVPQGTDHPGFVGYVPDVIVVEIDEAVFQKFNTDKFTRGRTGNRMFDKLCRQYGAGRIRRQFPGARQKWFRGRRLNLARWHKIHFKRNVDVAKVAAAFKKLDGVIDAQPVGIHRVHRIPNDPDYEGSSLGDQWHLNQANDADIDAPEAWEFETGNEEIMAAVLDTGVRYYHKDLGGSSASLSNPQGADGNMWINWEEKDGVAGLDDDENGFVDDWIGWDFVNGASGCWPGEDCTTADNDPRDFNGHGTHVSGIIAALNNNGYATASTAGGWGSGSLQPDGDGVKIMPLRIGYSYKYRGREVGVVRMDFAAEAFYYAADNGARLANASWGSSNDGGLGAALDYFLAAGGLIFKAAGNDPQEPVDYMGGRDDIINVAATDRNDCKASFSHFGTWVDISAPGVNILSTYHVHGDSVNDYVATASGTSMASPLSLSVAALIWSQHPSWTAAMVKRHLYTSADNIEGLSCNASYIGKLGAGRVNAFNAVGPCAGDLDNDGNVDGHDLAEFITRFESAQADEIDLEIFKDYFGSSGCPLR